MAKKKKYYKREFLREHYETKTFISNDGLHVERDYYDKESNQLKTYQPTICEDKYGRRYIYLKNYGELKIAELVISCYCAPKPKDGKVYEIEHIDGDLSNDHRNNLRWVEATPDYIAQKSVLLDNILFSRKMERYKSLKIKVLKDGTILQGKTILQPHYHFYDSDLDWHYHWSHSKVYYTYQNSYGRREEGSIYTDNLMDDFGFVSGDKTQFVKPVVLHINNDFLDFSPGNLEWCDATDPRYILYHQITQERCMNEDRQTNRKFLSPGSWKVVYPSMPYQQWSEWMTEHDKEYWTPERIQEDMERVWPSETLNDDETRSKKNS